MPKRHRKYREKHDNLTPYKMWILVGICLGYKLYNKQIENKFYLQKTIREALLVIPALPVLFLKNKGYIEDGKDKKSFSLTLLGFNVAHDRMKQAGVKPQNHKLLPNLSL
jgi:hypothetical protein